jgi:hypothetical protein
MKLILSCARKPCHQPCRYVKASHQDPIGSTLVVRSAVRGRVGEINLEPGQDETPSRVTAEVQDPEASRDWIG